MLLGATERQQPEVNECLSFRELNVPDVEDVNLAVNIAQKQEASREMERDDGVIVRRLEIDHAGRFICCNATQNDNVRYRVGTVPAFITIRIESWQ